MLRTLQPVLNRVRNEKAVGWLGSSSIGKGKLPRFSALALTLQACCYQPEERRHESTAY